MRSEHADNIRKLTELIFEYQLLKHKHEECINVFKKDISDRKKLDAAYQEYNQIEHDLIIKYSAIEQKIKEEKKRKTNKALQSFYSKKEQKFILNLEADKRIVNQRYQMLQYKIITDDHLSKLTSLEDRIKRHINDASMASYQNIRKQMLDDIGKMRLHVEAMQKNGKYDIDVLEEIAKKTAEIGSNYDQIERAILVVNQKKLDSVDVMAEKIEKRLGELEKKVVAANMMMRAGGLSEFNKKMTAEYIKILKGMRDAYKNVKEAYAKSGKIDAADHQRINAVYKPLNEMNVISTVLLSNFEALKLMNPLAEKLINLFKNDTKNAPAAIRELIELYDKFNVDDEVFKSKIADKSLVGKIKQLVINAVNECIKNEKEYPGIKYELAAMFLDKETGLVNDEITELFSDKQYHLDKLLDFSKNVHEQKMKGPLEQYGADPQQIYEHFKDDLKRKIDVLIEKFAVLKNYKDKSPFFLEKYKLYQSLISKRDELIKAIDTNIRDKNFSSDEVDQVQKKCNQLIDDFASVDCLQDIKQYDQIGAERKRVESARRMLESARKQFKAEVGTREVRLALAEKQKVYEELKSAEDELKNVIISSVDELNKVDVSEFKKFQAIFEEYGGSENADLAPLQRYLVLMNAYLHDDVKLTDQFFEGKYPELFGYIVLKNNEKMQLIAGANYDPINLLDELKGFVKEMNDVLIKMIEKYSDECALALTEIELLKEKFNALMDTLSNEDKEEYQSFNQLIDDQLAPIEKLYQEMSLNYSPAKIDDKERKRQMQVIDDLIEKARKINEKRPEIQKKSKVTVNADDLAIALQAHVREDIKPAEIRKDVQEQNQRDKRHEGQVEKYKIDQMLQQMPAERMLEAIEKAGYLFDDYVSNMSDESILNAYRELEDAYLDLSLQLGDYDEDSINQDYIAIRKQIDDAMRQYQTFMSANNLNFGPNIGDISVELIKAALQKRQGARPEFSFRLTNEEMVLFPINEQTTYFNALKSQHFFEVGSGGFAQAQKDFARNFLVNRQLNLGLDTAQVKNINEDNLRQRIAELLNVDDKTASHLIAAHSQGPAAFLPLVVSSAVSHRDQDIYIDVKQPPSPAINYLKKGDEIYLHIEYDPMQIVEISPSGAKDIAKTGPSAAIYKMCEVDGKWGFQLQQVLTSDPLIAQAMLGMKFETNDVRDYINRSKQQNELISWMMDDLVHQYQGLNSLLISLSDKNEFRELITNLSDIAIPIDDVNLIMIASQLETSIEDVISIVTSYEIFIKNYHYLLKMLIDNNYLGELKNLVHINESLAANFYKLPIQEIPELNNLAYVLSAAENNNFDPGLAEKIIAQRQLFQTKFSVADFENHVGSDTPVSAPDYNDIDAMLAEMGIVPTPKTDVVDKPIAADDGKPSDAEALLADLEIKPSLPINDRTAPPVVGSEPMPEETRREAVINRDVTRSPSVKSDSPIVRPDKTVLYHHFHQKHFHDGKLMTNREYYETKVINNDGFSKKINYLHGLALAAEMSVADRDILLNEKPEIEAIRNGLIEYMTELERKTKEGSSKRYQEAMTKIGALLAKLDDVIKAANKMAAHDVKTFKAHGTQIERVAKKDVDATLKTLTSTHPVSSTFKFSDQKKQGVEIDRVATSDQLAIVTNQISDKTSMHTVFDQSCNRVIINQHVVSSNVNDQRKQGLFGKKDATLKFDEDVLISAVIAIDDALDRFGNRLLIDGASKDPQLKQAMILYCALMASQGRPVELISQGVNLADPNKFKKELKSFEVMIKDIKPKMVLFDSAEKKAIEKAAKIQQQTSEAIHQHIKPKT